MARKRKDPNQKRMSVNVSVTREELDRIGKLSAREMGQALMRGISMGSVGQYIEEIEELRKKVSFFNNEICARNDIIDRMQAKIKEMEGRK